MSDDKKQSLQEWMEEERARLKKGFTFQRQPLSEASKPKSADQVLAGVGLGAGVVGGALAPHPNPATFEGCPADVIVSALREEIANNDTRIRVGQTGDAVVVTLLQSQEHQPHQFAPALTVTLVEKMDTLTVTVSELNQDTTRTTISSVGRTVLDQGKRWFTRRNRRGIGGLIDTAGNVMEGVEDLVEDIQDLGLPKRVWKVIDRVGEAAEQAYWDERRKRQEQERQRKAAERAWTHCEWCGRAYGSDEEQIVECPACGAPRGSRPAWLK